MCVLMLWRVKKVLWWLLTPSSNDIDTYIKFIKIFLPFSGQRSYCIREIMGIIAVPGIMVALTFVTLQIYKIEVM